jgi:hypothetical protein
MQLVPAKLTGEIEVKPLRCKSVRVCRPDDRARVCSETVRRAYEGSHLIYRSQRTGTQSQSHSALARSQSGYCRAFDLSRRFLTRHLSKDMG